MLLKFFACVLVIHTAYAAEYTYTLRNQAFPNSGHPGALVHTSPTFNPQQRPYKLLVYLHGWNNCIQSIGLPFGQGAVCTSVRRSAYSLFSNFDAQKMTNALLVFPELPYDQESGSAGQLGRTNGFRLFLEELFSDANFGSVVGGGINIGTDIARIAVMSHSGGYGTTAAFASRGGVPSLRQIALFDSMYGNAADFESFIERAARAGKVRGGDCNTFRFANFYGSSTQSTSEEQAGNARAFSQRYPSLLASSDLVWDTSNTAPLDTTSLNAAILFKKTTNKYHDEIPRYWFPYITSVFAQDCAGEPMGTVPPPTSAPSDPQCVSAGGKCVSSAVGCSNGAFKSGLCPSFGADVRCCIPSSPPAPTTVAPTSVPTTAAPVVTNTQTPVQTPSSSDPQCISRAGVCQITTQTCYGGSYISGLCPTKPANVKCCVPTCSVSGYCGGHASAAAVSSSGACQCTCSGMWVGSRCNVCPEGAAGDNCDRCADGYVLTTTGSYKMCRQCTSQQDCNNRALSLSTTSTNQCSCHCRNKWQGAQCQTCPSPFSGPDCAQCLDPTQSYPRCGTTSAPSAVPTTSTPITVYCATVTSASGGHVEYPCYNNNCVMDTAGGATNLCVISSNPSGSPYPCGVCS